MAGQKDVPDLRPVVDVDFLELFLPPEIRLAQRRSMLQCSQSLDGALNSCLGFYLVRVDPAPGKEFPPSSEGGAFIGDHVQALLSQVVRDSDIPARLSDQEQLVILRDLDPNQTFVVSQRFLSSAADSAVLQAADLYTRVGYVIYPLSSQPNHPPQQWESLVGLARTMSAYGNPTGRATGHGLLRGPNMMDTGIGESDLIPLAIRDPGSLVKVGLVQILKIHLVSTG